MPISVIAAAILTSVDWHKVFKGLATDAAGKGAKNLLSHLKPSEREKHAKHVIELFVEEFVGEIEDKPPSAPPAQVTRINSSASLKTTPPPSPPISSPT